MAGVNQVSIDALNLSTGASATHEPLRPYNFTFEIPGIEPLLVRSFPLPTVSNEEIAIPHGNEEVFIAGKAKFEAGELVIMDDVNSDAFNALTSWRESVYTPSDGNIQLAGNYKKDGTIKQYMPDGNPVRAWKLVGCWPTKLTPGNLSHDEGSGFMKISCTIRYDKAYPVA